MRTIRGRLLALLLPGLAIVLFAGGAAVYLIARASLLRQFDAVLEARVQNLASLVSYENGHLVFDLGREAVDTIGGTYFEFRTSAGQLLKRSDNLAGSSLPMPAALKDELAVGDVELPGQIDGRAVWMTFSTPVDHQVDHEREPDEEDERVAAAWSDAQRLIVAAAIDREPLDRMLATLLGALILVGCILAVTVGMLITVGVRYGLAPLNRMSRQLARVSGESVSNRIDHAGASAELTPVYHELNGMLERMGHTIERERSFADAAAHELRTPLAELRSTAEVAIRWPDSARAAASLKEVLSIGGEMERLVESLLLISRANAGEIDGSKVEVPFAKIVGPCLARVRGEIDHKRLRVTDQLGDVATLPVSPAALEIIVRNLIDNAVQYTPPGGSIAIRAERNNGGAVALIVENGPVELAESDVSRLFEPFWRLEQARTDREHVGLGLAVVDRLAHATGLQVRAALVGDHLQMRVFSAI